MSQFSVKENCGYAISEPGKTGCQMAAIFKIIIGNIVLAAIVSIADMAAQAQTQQQLDWCNGKGGATPDLTIGGCTAVIQSGKFTGEILAVAFYARGSAHQAKGQHDPAIVDYDQAIKLNPNFGAAFYNRGTAYASKDHYDRALQDYDKVITLKPGEPMGYIQRGRAYKSLKRYDAALADFQKAVQINPNFYRAYDNRGDAYVSKGSLDEAIADYSKTVQLNPAFTDGWWDRGRANQYIGSFTLAASDFAKVVKLAPNFHWASLHLMIATYLSRGDTSMAVSQFRQRLVASKPEPWLLALSEYYTGTDGVDENEIMTKAKDGKTKKESSRRLSDAYFYIAAKRLMDGNKIGATEYLQKCVSLGGTSFAYLSAKYLLPRVNTGP